MDYRVDWQTYVLDAILYDNACRVCRGGAQVGRRQDPAQGAAQTRGGARRGGVSEPYVFEQVFPANAREPATSSDTHTCHYGAVVHHALVRPG